MPLLVRGLGSSSGWRLIGAFKHWLNLPHAVAKAELAYRIERKSSIFAAASKTNTPPPSGASIL